MEYFPAHKICGFISFLYLILAFNLNEYTECVIVLRNIVCVTHMHTDTLFLLLFHSVFFWFI